MIARNGRSLSISTCLYLWGIVIVRPPGGGDWEL
jgi:hypothetical protein